MGEPKTDENRNQTGRTENKNPANSIICGETMSSGDVW